MKISMLGATAETRLPRQTPHDAPEQDDPPAAAVGEGRGDEREEDAGAGDRRARSRASESETPKLSAIGSTFWPNSAEPKLAIVAASATVAMSVGLQRGERDRREEQRTPDRLRERARSCAAAAIVSAAWRAAWVSDRLCAGPKNHWKNGM